MAKQLLIDN